MLNMPESCTGQAAYKDIAAVAADRLQQQLGDLEQVWADDLLTKQLLALSEAALWQLLQHQGMRVASENTVAYTVQRWYEAQNDFSALAAAVRLMRLVRMRHCTPLYIGTVLSSSTVFCSCFSQQDIALAGLCCTASGYEALTASKCKVLDKYLAWSAEKRPATARPLTVKLRLELSKLKTTVEDFLGSAHQVPSCQMLQQTGVSCKGTPCA